jgi:hypothetical protein
VGLSDARAERWGGGVQHRGRASEGEDVGDPLGDKAGSMGGGRRVVACSATGGSTGPVGNGWAEDGGEARN